MAMVKCNLITRNRQVDMPMAQNKARKQIVYRPVIF